MPFATPEFVVTRALNSAFAECLKSDASAVIDVPLALCQHEGYIAALRAVCGESAHVHVGEGSTSADDGYIEDSCVVLDRHHAVLTQPGAPSRRPEVAAVAAVLAAPPLSMQLHVMAGDALCDGGDVLRASDELLLVGLSKRTNAAGAAFLAAAAASCVPGLRVVSVPVPAGLHLKSAVTLVTPSLALYDAAVLAGADLAALRAALPATLELLPAPDAFGANVLALGGTVLVSAATPATVAYLATRGVALCLVEASECHKGDGALTCGSLRVPSAGNWAT